MTLLGTITGTVPIRYKINMNEPLPVSKEARIKSLLIDTLKLGKMFKFFIEEKIDSSEEVYKDNDNNGGM